MAIPDLPPFYDMNYAKEDGKLTDEAVLYHDQTYQSLNAMLNLMNNGFSQPKEITDNVMVPSVPLIPPMTTTQITDFGTNTDVALGAMWYDTDNNVMKIKTADGLIKTLAFV